MNEEKLQKTLSTLRKLKHPIQLMYIKDLDANKDTGQWFDDLYENVQTIAYSKTPSIVSSDCDKFEQKIRDFKRYSNNHQVAVYYRQNGELVEVGVL